MGRVFVFVCVEAKEGKESFHSLTHPPTFLFCFGPFFLRLAVFVAGQYRAFLK